MDDESDEGIVIAGFNKRLIGPLRKFEHFAGSFVLAFNDHSLRMQAHASDITTVLCPTACSTFDTVVAQLVGQGLSNGGLKRGAFLLVPANGARLAGS